MIDWGVIQQPDTLSRPPWRTRSRLSSSGQIMRHGGGHVQLERVDCLRRPCAAVWMASVQDGCWRSSAQRHPTSTTRVHLGVVARDAVPDAASSRSAQSRLGHESADGLGWWKQMS
jgi:hypothetical protein